MNLTIQRTHPDATVPAYATAGAACFDLVAIDDGTPHPADIDATVYRTGLAFEVPPGWCMEVHSRSGHGFNHAIRLSNCTGIIDSDYRGEVLVALRCEAYRRQPMPRKGDRVAQAKLVPAPQVTFQVVDQLSDTPRGTGGFGSTGA